MPSAAIDAVDCYLCYSYSSSLHYIENGIEAGCVFMQQEDIRNYIESSIKHGVQLSAFRKERIGGDSCGISYW